MTTPPQILQEQLRRRLDARRLNRLLGDGGLSGRSGLVAPMARRRSAVSDHGIPMPEPFTNGKQVIGSAQLLVMAASGDSIASGGDYVTFTTLAAQHGFAGVSAAGASWVHPTGGVYVLEYEHVWDSYEDGGTIELELDGEVSTANTIASGVSGALGRGLLVYAAAAGSVGKIKVTQSSGSAETCDATVWIGITDPAIVDPSGSANVLLFIDDVQVASASGDVGVSFSSATLLLGEISGGTVTASDFSYDEVTIDDGVSNLLANGGFESALLAGTGSTAVATGNWRAFKQQAGHTIARSGSPVNVGSWAGQATIVAGTGGGYFLQDVALAPGGLFDAEAMVYRASGTQAMVLLLDWDRTLGAPHSAIVEMSPTQTSFTAFGLSGIGPPIPASTWTKVTLRVGVAA